MQRESLSTLKRVLKDEYNQHAPEQRQALAKMLWQQATLDKNPPPMRFVMLHQAIELATGTGDAALAFQAADALAQIFALDLLELKVSVLVQAAARAQSLNQWEAITNLGLPLLDCAVREERYALGQKTAQIAEAAAAKSKHVELVALVQTRLVEFHILLTACTTAQAALTVLDQHPLDGPANLSAGRYACFVRGDWPAGLVHLAQCSDEALKTLAIREMVQSDDPIHQLELADRWWEMGENYKGWMQRTIRDHAAAWYHTALGNLNGVTLARISQRIKVNATVTTAPFENTVNLLALVDPARDAVAGIWKAPNGVLASDDIHHARLAFPYEPPEEYDLRLEFVVAQKGGSLAVLLSQHGTPFGWAMGVQTNHLCRFESINKRAHAGNPTEVKLALRTDRKYILVLQVRKDGVTAILDGKTLCQYKTDYKDMSRYTPWKMPNEKALGLGSSAGALVVYSAEVVEIGGSGKKLR